jgi:hypothetical protein
VETVFCGKNRATARVAPTVVQKKNGMKKYFSIIPDWNPEKLL